MKLILGSCGVVDVVERPDRWRESLKKFDGKLVCAGTRLNLKDYPAEEYLFTHNTIVASVDVEPKKSHYIKPECSKFVNDNGDAWERGLLAGTYRTFIGSPNYQEHIQLPQLRRGWIVDAQPREVPGSLYIDILVATERKHKTLVADIEAGRMRTMSMGSLVQFTKCSCCGNVSYGEADLCDCIRNFKRSTFVDEDGKERIIAELCGSVDDLESNRFIEGSWVRDPAFKGAVTRSIVNPSKELLSKLSALEKQGKISDIRNMKQKVAYMVWLHGPQYGIYPPFLVEDRVSEDEDHSVESASQEPLRLPNEMELQDSASRSGSVGFNSYFVERLVRAGIKFSDVLDFVDLCERTLGSGSDINSLIIDARKRGLFKF